MTQETHVTLLRRKTRSQTGDVAENPLTSSRAVRLALVKAANDTVGLELSVSSVADEVSTLDQMLDALPGGLMLLGLQRGGDLVGFVGVDMQFRAAALEMQTMGRVAGQPAEDRKATRADRTLCDPLIARFVADLPEAALGTSIEGWAEGATHGDIIADPRAAGLLLPDQPYRSVQMNVHLSGTDRQGILLVALPPVAKPVVETPATEGLADWHDAFQATVAEAPSALSAVLHRFDVPLATARALKVGTVLPLPGCTVGSVRLIAADGHFVATAKLGQSNGMRAVKLQPPPMADLQELTPDGASHPNIDVAPDEAMLTVAPEIEVTVPPEAVTDPAPS